MPEATAESPLAEMQNEQFATCHRERGNGLYKGGKLLEGNHLQLHLRLKEDYLTFLLSSYRRISRRVCHRAGGPTPAF